jgi:hypothetical protein
LPWLGFCVEGMLEKRQRAQHHHNAVNPAQEKADTAQRNDGALRGIHTMVALKGLLTVRFWQGNP